MSEDFLLLNSDNNLENLEILEPKINNNNFYSKVSINNKTIRILTPRLRLLDDPIINDDNNCIIDLEIPSSEEDFYDLLKRIDDQVINATYNKRLEIF